MFHDLLEKMNPLQQTEEISRYIISTSPTLFNYIHNKTKDLVNLYIDEIIREKYVWDNNIRKTPLTDIPIEFQTEELYLKLICYNGFYLEFIDKTRITKLMCIIALDKDVRTIKHFPERYLTEEFYLKAIDKNYLIYSNPNFIKENKKNQIMSDSYIDSIIKNNSSYISSSKDILTSIPSDFQTEELLFKIVNINGKYLEYIDKDKRTLSLCNRAINQIIESSPKNLLIEKVKLMLDKIIPKNFQTLPFYSSLVAKNNTLMEIVPSEFKDKLL
jgi:hypothetical protein